MRREHNQYDLNAHIQEVLSVIHPSGDTGKNTEPDEETLETIHVYPVEGGGILLTRTPLAEDEDLDTTPLPTPSTNQPTANAALGVWFFGLFVILSCLTFQCYVLFNPLTVTVTLAAESQQFSLQGTLQLGRVLHPLTLSQSQTVPTTGRGHQDARSATGYITFYNGQLQSVTVPTGTLLTGSDGTQIATDQDANIPPESQTIPPTLGQTTVSAHAIVAGTRGNISTGDINQSCCATSILVQNTAPFHGGQDERNFQTVAKSDIDNGAAPLKITLNQSVQGALQGQLKQGEQLQRLPCSPTVTPDHQLGQEDTAVKVTVSETCSGIAYNDQELTDKVTQLLTTQATKQLGLGYSMLENPHITVASAITSKPVKLAFRSVSIWIYALTTKVQHQIKKMIAGKSTQNALQLLHRLPGIESVALHFSGFGDVTKLPKDLVHMHLLLLYTTG